MVHFYFSLPKKVPTFSKYVNNTVGLYHFLYVWGTATELSKKTLHQKPFSTANLWIILMIIFHQIDQRIYKRQHFWILIITFQMQTYLWIHKNCEKIGMFYACIINCSEELGGPHHHWLMRMHNWVTWWVMMSHCHIWNRFYLSNLNQLTYSRWTLGKS